jgi:hypothetical protein
MSNKRVYCRRREIKKRKAGCERQPVPKLLVSPLLAVEK